jgi:hypothetical protein
MAAIAAETARGARASGDVFSGALLASGAAALFVGTLFYARLTPELGLPALPAERTQALADALKLGPQPLALAGGFAFLGDCLLLAACIALASRSPRSSNLDTAGWALIAVSVALAAVFDSMTAALLFPLAHGADPAPFVAVKRGSTFCSPPATFLTGWASSPSCARTSAAAGRCCRGLCRMSGSLSEPRRRSAVSARRSASCICPLLSASASRSAA